MVSSEIKTLNNDIDEKKVMEIVKSEGHKLKEPNNADIGSNIREMEDRNARKGNFMIFNAPEIESNLKNDVEKSNCQIANKILKLCGASEEVTAEQTIRLGAKGGNTRPILVKLKNLDEKRVLFKNFEAKMKTCIDKSIKGSKINHDLTKLQKTEETKLYNEAKEREKEDGKKVQSEGSLLGPKSGRSNSLKTSESTVNKKHVNSSYVNNGKLSCIYTNADQLNNKFNELQLLVKTHDPDIIAITEVKPKNCRFQPQIGEYLLDGYNMWGGKH